MRGRIKFYHKRQRYGFIEADNGKDVFFHITAFNDEDEDTIPTEDDIVEFTTEHTDKGLRATNISFTTEE